MPEKDNQVQPSRLVKMVATLYPRASSPSSSMHLGYSLYCLPDSSEFATVLLMSIANKLELMFINVPINVNVSSMN